jgi:pyruvate formate lyase activating enzyme
MKSDEAKLYTVDELLKIIKANMPFIRGITVSGGESTLYFEFLVELFKRVHDLNLTCYVDTNGFYDTIELQELIQHTDKFLFDIKARGESLASLCFSKLESSALAKNYYERFIINEQHFNNLEVLLKQDKIEEVRLVYIKGYYDVKNTVNRITQLIKPYTNVIFKLIRVHVRGLPKARAVKLKGVIPSKAEVDKLELYIKSLGVQNIAKIY